MPKSKKIKVSAVFAVLQLIQNALAKEDGIKASLFRIADATERIAKALEGGSDV